MTGGQAAALLFAVRGYGSLTEGHVSSAVAALQIAVPILAMAGALFWLARRRPLPPSRGAGS